MIKVEVTEQFTLGKIKEIKNLVRAHQENVENKLNVGDTFECEQDMVDYLTGGNHLGRAFVKVIEIIPEEKEIKDEPVKKTTTRKTSTKKSVVKK